MCLSAIDVKIKDKLKFLIQAIEHGDISSLEQAIHELKDLKHGSPELLNTHCLTTGNGVMYFMTLLAFCGFHKQRDMVNLLMKEGAGTCMIMISCI